MTHGTQYAYRIGRCRCDECKEWRRASQRAYYHRRRQREPGWHYLKKTRDERKKARGAR